MTVARAHIRTTYFLAGIGFLAMFISGEIPLYLVALSTLTLIFSYDYEKINFKPRLPIALWNILAFVFLLYETTYALLGRREFILNVAEFLVVIQSILLWTRKENRHYQQIFGVSLLHLVAAAVLTADITFAAIYLTYIVAGTWSLVVFNLQRELKNLQQSEAAVKKAGEILTPRFFAALSLISVLVFLCSMVLFMCFPRLNYNYLASLSNAGGSTSGFTDQIRLGEIGKIKLSDKPVMHISLSGAKADEVKSDDFYLRGMILNHYDGKKWTFISVGRRETINTLPNGIIPMNRRAAEDYNVVQDIVAEPSGNSILFALAKPVAIQAPMGNVTHVDRNNLTGIFSESRRLKYTIYSDWQRPQTYVQNLLKDSANGTYEDDFNVTDYRWFLQVPRSLDARIGVFARELSARGKSPLRKAVLISDYLKTQFHYSLNMSDPGNEDPLGHFLFVEKSGHCEYFASSLAMMLRTLGIPSRIVSGYAFGEWNEVGKFYLIRERHAHTWVEALLPGTNGTLAWVPFDATPPDPSFLPQMGVLERWGQAMDSLKLLWLNWVVDYDFQKQASNAKTAIQTGKNLSHDVNLNLEFLRKLFRNETQLSALQEFWLKRSAAILVLALIFVMLIQVSRRGWSRVPKAAAGVSPFYRKLQKILKRKGIERAPSLTPWEFYDDTVQRFGKTLGAKGVLIFKELTETFCRFCYGPFRFDAKAEVRIKQLLAELRQSLKRSS